MQTTEQTTEQTTKQKIEQTTKQKIDKSDDWIGAATAQLERLDAEPHAQKKRATVIALVGAKLAGLSEETVFEPRRPETCSRNVYVSKWKHQALFADVLAQVTRLAREFMDGSALRAKQEAARKLAIASPIAVDVAVELLDSEDPSVRLKAAFGVMDRAGIETAPKGMQSTVVQLTWGEAGDNNDLSDGG